MDFNIVTECISCSQRKACNEEVVEVDGKQRVINFCRECYEEIEEIQKWASSL